jgi:peptidoglycan/LPS O-acetylase OafA/YrhL
VSLGNTRAPGLDGVRAIAVLAVLGFHEGLSWLPGGFLGVDVFFVLSGYLITDQLATRANGSIRRFWVRRARRLLPALLVMLTGIAAVVAVLVPAQLAVLRPAITPALSYTSNWYEAVHHSSYFDTFGPVPPLKHLWSLAIEEQFYILWPLAVLLLGKLGSNRMRSLITAGAAAASALAAAFLYAPGTDPSRVYYGTDTHSSALLIGSALAFALPLADVRALPTSWTRLADGAGLASLAVLTWAFVYLSGSDPLVYPYGLLIAAVAASGLVVAAASGGLVAAATSLAPFRWLGIRSYGIYLWHWPIIAVGAALPTRQGPQLSMAEVAITFAIAAASWRFIEAPIQREGLVAATRHWNDTCRGPARAITCSLGLAVASTAAYGLLSPLPSSGLAPQIAAGQRAVAATQVGVSPKGVAPRVKERGHKRVLRLVPCGGDGVTAIGDSVMVAAAPELATRLRGIYLDAQIGRQMAAGLSVARYLASHGELRRVVVVGLGTNGPIAGEQLRELGRLAGRRRALVLVTTFVPRPWDAEVNDQLMRFARHRHRVVLANWAGAIADRTGLLWDDGVHPRPAGGTLYARVVARSVAAACGQLTVPVRSSERVHRRSARSGSRMRGRK